MNNKNQQNVFYFSNSSQMSLCSQCYSQRPILYVNQSACKNCLQMYPVFLSSVHLSNNSVLPVILSTLMLENVYVA